MKVYAPSVREEEGEEAVASEEAVINKVWSIFICPPEVRSKIPTSVFPCVYRGFRGEWGSSVCDDVIPNRVDEKPSLIYG